MFAAYVAVSVVTAFMNAVSAALTLIRHERVTAFMAKANMPESWMTMLGGFKAAGALGLLIGFWFPLIGTAAAVGLTTFFVLAITAHLRAHDYSFGPQYAFLPLAVVTLTLGLAHNSLS